MTPGLGLQKDSHIRLSSLAQRGLNVKALLNTIMTSYPKVASVRWPGLASHPQYELAHRQLDVLGGQLAFELVGGLDAGRTFVEAVQIAQLATSLGGPETLVTHPASTTHVGLSPEELEAAGIQPSTIRVSVGLEHADDLIADFAQAINQIR